MLRALHNPATASFPDVFGISGGSLPPPRTLNELLMVKLSASIRSKSEWWKKYKDSEIRTRWREEALNAEMVWIEKATMLVPLDEAPRHFAAGSRNEEDSVVKLSKKEVDYVLDELDGYAKLRDEETGIQVSCFDGIWHSDSLIKEELRERLKRGVSVLENVPDSEKDWHPGSNDQVLDLVHPSLHCVVYGRTLAIPRSHSGSQERPEPKPLMVPEFIRGCQPTLRSERFQWLPTDFSVSDDGKVKALGYINNLHPSHSELYETVEGILSAFVPIFDHILTDILNPLPQRLPDNYLPLKEVDPNHPQNEDAEDYYDQVDEYMKNVWRENKIVGLPQLPEDGYSGGLEERENIFSLRGRTIQVIVKLANIHLTPENPEYKGGSWHIEGMVNERIVASGLYYYDQENITGSELAFRIAVDEPEIATRIQADTYDYYAHYKTWGMVMAYDGSTKLNNVVGATGTIEGRCLAFPNTYQHRVSPFKLEDPTKPGHRKILALFLVDPSLKEPIPSTSIVPPQQRKWIKQALQEAGSNTLLRRLPIEILNAIADQAGPEVTSEEEAKAIRSELIEERKMAKKREESNYVSLYSRVFNLCEH
ncbi:hypothetical protein ACEPAF_4367 [Sanghuangporus sanghuang]